MYKELKWMMLIDSTVHCGRVGEHKWISEFVIEK